jgi:hypothetical protein
LQHSQMIMSKEIKISYLTQITTHWCTCISMCLLLPILPLELLLWHKAVCSSLDYEISHFVGFDIWVRKHELPIAVYNLDMFV